MKDLENLPDFSAHDIDTIRYHIKKLVFGKLPELPDPVETMLFLKGRTPWNYKWKLIKTGVSSSSKPFVNLEATVKLKREFHQFCSDVEHCFSCRAELTDDPSHPKVQVTKKASPKTIL